MVYSTLTSYNLIYSEFNTGDFGIGPCTVRTICYSSNHMLLERGLMKYIFVLINKLFFLNSLQPILRLLIKFILEKFTITKLQFIIDVIVNIIE